MDEITGIQALERLMQDIPMKPGRFVKVEFEYRRHGTQILIASFNVASGRVDQAEVADRRTEEDFATHIKALLNQHPDVPKTHSVMDCNQWRPEQIS